MNQTGAGPVIISVARMSSSAEPNLAACCSSISDVFVEGGNVAMCWTPHKSCQTEHHPPADFCKVRVGTAWTNWRVACVPLFCDPIESCDHSCRKHLSSLLGK